jgi:hypothetical protein
MRHIGNMVSQNLQHTALANPCVTAQQHDLTLTVFGLLSEEH